MGARRVRFATTMVTFLALVMSTLIVATDIPDPLVVKVQDALKTHASGDFDGALVLYDLLIDDPSLFGKLSASASASILNNAGGIRYGKGDALGALPYFEKATLVDSTHAESLVNLAVLLSEDMGKHEEALKLARDALKLRPTHTKTHHLLGNILQRLGHLPEAHLRFKTAETLAREENQREQDDGNLEDDVENQKTLYKRYAPHYVGYTQNSGDFVLETVSVVPPVFRMRSFLTQSERNTIIESAKPAMETSRTIADSDGNTYEPRISSTAWLPTMGDEVLDAITKRAAGILDLNAATIFLSSERLQVLKYEKGGYFDVHHESTAFLNRFATLIYYLDGPGYGNGGETVFPFGPDGAGWERHSEQGTDEEKIKSSGILLQGNITKACGMGVKTSPIPGDAILFYNFLENDDIDHYAIHAACEVTSGTKWAANHWFNVPEKRKTHTSEGKGREGKEELK